jgi:hypothetical protein
LTLANNSLPLSGAGGSLIGVLSVSWATMLSKWKLKNKKLWIIALNYKLWYPKSL